MNRIMPAPRPLVALVNFVLATSASAFLHAQESTDETISEVVVTGTRVADRSRLDTLSPVDVLTERALTRQGTRELAQALSTAAPSLDFPRPAATDGTDSIRPAALRGLSPDQTLVLVDGKRRHATALVNLNGSVGRGSAAVDLDAIPLAALDRIEVLRDGSRGDTWIALGQIRAVVDVPDRTLRNWLRNLIEEGVVESQGERKGRRYRIRARSIAPAAGAIAVDEQAPTVAVQPLFSAECQAVIKRVEAPLYTRTPATYRENWLQAYIPNESAYLTPRRREELEALGKRDPIYGQAGTYIQKIYHRLLIDFAFNSSRLEGNTYSLIDTERLLLQGTAAPGKPNAERIMILNHKEAIDYLARRIDTLQADETTIRTLHYLLADSLVAPGAAGQIRGDYRGL